MTKTTVQAGNTVMLICKFYDDKDGVVSPSVVKFITYDYQYNILSQTDLEPTSINQDGYYVFHYVTPKENQNIIYEFYGEIGGYPSLKRGELVIKWVA